MGSNHLIVGSNEIQNVAKAYVNFFNAINSFVKPTQPTCGKANLATKPISRDVGLVARLAS